MGDLIRPMVCRPTVSVITSVSHDHTQLLGETIPEIAAEKAGIIKSGTTVVSGVATEAAGEVIAQVARANDAPLIVAGVDFEYGYTSPRELNRRDISPRVSIQLAHSPDAWRQLDLADIELGLLGRHQAANAAVAVATIAELVGQGWAIDADALRSGLASVHWPARAEIIQRRPTVLVDAAHNVASITALIETLNESFTTRRRVLVFGTSQDKPVGAMLARLLPTFDEIVFTRYLDSPRAVEPDELQRLASDISGVPTHVCPTPSASWQLAAQLAGEQDLVCITGSCFIAAQLREVVLEKRPTTTRSTCPSSADLVSERGVQ